MYIRILILHCLFVKFILIDLELLDPGQMALILILDFNLTNKRTADMGTQTLQITGTSNVFDIIS